MRPAHTNIHIGAAGRGRTDMTVRSHDFESCVSANSTTAAKINNVRGKSANSATRPINTSKN
jgi:hypothetical protein